MTFEQWWAQHGVGSLADKQVAAACWNAAVDASWSSTLATDLPRYETLASQIIDALHSVQVKL